MDRSFHTQQPPPLALIAATSLSVFSHIALLAERSAIRRLRNQISYNHMSPRSERDFRIEIPWSWNSNKCNQKVKNDSNDKTIRKVPFRKYSRHESLMKLGKKFGIVLYHSKIDRISEFSLNFLSFINWLSITKNVINLWLD